MKSDNIDAAIAELTERKEKLQRLVELRLEVAALEIEVMTGTTVNGMPKIIDAVCHEFSITIEQLMSLTRRESVTLPRQTAYYLVRKLCGLSYLSLGRAFNKDHGTIMHGEQAVKNRIETDPLFSRRMDRLEKHCTLLLATNGNGAQTILTDSTSPTPPNTACSATPSRSLSPGG